MRRIFIVEIGYEEETGVYRADVVSTEDNKGTCIQAASLKLLLVEVSKKVRKRNQQNRRFPIAEPSRILTVDQAGVGQIITPVRN